MFQRKDEKKGSCFICMTESALPHGVAKGDEKGRVQVKGREEHFYLAEVTTSFGHSVQACFSLSYLYREKPPVFPWTWKQGQLKDVRPVR